VTSSGQDGQGIVPFQFISGVEIKAESICICFIDDCMDCDVPLAELTFSREYLALPSELCKVTVSYCVRSALSSSSLGLVEFQLTVLWCWWWLHDVLGFWGSFFFGWLVFIFVCLFYVLFLRRLRSMQG